MPAGWWGLRKSALLRRSSPSLRKPVVNFNMPRAILLAFALEVLIVAAVADVLSKKPVAIAQEKQDVVMLTFPTPPVAKPQPPKPKPPEPKPPPPKPVHHVVRHQEPRPIPKPQIVQSAPTPQPVAVPLPPVPKPPPVPDTAPAVSDVFKETVREAVQAAVRYPYAAREGHITGKAQVSFTYLDGSVANPKILVSSGYSMLDRAAIAAVEDAAYPPPPSRLAGKTLTFEVWVNFTLSSY